MMLMAYAPWCKFCKIMKPDYAGAATELKDFAVMAAMDVTRPENSIVSKFLNVTGFPTLFSASDVTPEGRRKSVSPPWPPCRER